MLKKLKKAWEIIAYPLGRDAELDSECENSFHRFLDRVTTLFYVLFAAFGLTSIYFFVTHELMK